MNPLTKRFLRNQRLSKRDFNLVFVRPSKISTINCVAMVRVNQLIYSRLGIVTKKNYIKSAVDRNWIRRIVRESFRANQARVKGLDIVLIMRANCVVLSKHDLRQKVDGLWEKLISHKF